MGPHGEPTNFVTEQLLSGNVTLNLIMICFGVASVAVAITLWAVYRFQTKTDARESETRLNDGIKAEAALRKSDIAGIHDHLKKFGEESKDERREAKGELIRMQADLSGLRTTLSNVESTLGYIKGKLEPRT